MRKPSSPIALPADPQQGVDGCMWREGVLALEMAAPLLPTGHLLFSLLSLCACARASDYSDYLTVFGLSTSTPPTPL